MKDIKTELADASNSLGFDIWSHVRSTAGNLTLSPISVSSALAMTLGGARGHTAVEIAKVMNVDHIDGDIMIEFGKFMTELQLSPGIKLRIANRLFGERSYLFHQSYVEQTRAAFGAPFEGVDFRAMPDASRLYINEEIAAQTENLIRDLLPSGAIDGTTRLVLTNAVYFLADWQTKFLARITLPGPFQLVDGRSSEAMMMTRQAKQRYGRVGNVQLLELPYAGDNISMLIALPDRVDGITNLDRHVNTEMLASWRRAVITKKVEVYLPRFKLDPVSSLNLVPTMRELGIVAAFDPDEADFTGMAPPSGEPFYISSVFHKTFVKTDEDGTEAAAATSVAVARGVSRDEDIPVFRADHPFLFLIQDDTTGAVLFMGRVSDPSKS